MSDLSDFLGLSTTPAGDFQAEVGTIIYSPIKEDFLDDGKFKRLDGSVLDRNTYSEISTIWPSGYDITESSVNFLDPGFGDYINSISHDGGGNYIACGQSAKLATSSNGIKWTQQTVSGFTGSATFKEAQYGNSLWVAVGQNNSGNPQISTSTDAITWVSRSSTSTGTILHGVHYANGLWVAVGDSGHIETSTDGTSWTSQTSGLSEPLYAVHYDNGIWVAVGGNSGNTKITTSTNGTSWTAQTAGTTGALHDVFYGGGYWCAVGEDAYVYTSTDGTTWVQQARMWTATSQHAESVVYDGSKWIAVGGTVKYYEVVDPTATWTVLDTLGLDTADVGTVEFPLSITYDSFSDRYIVVGRTTVAGAGNGVGIMLANDPYSGYWTVVDTVSNVSSDTVFKKFRYKNNTWVSVSPEGSVAAVSDNGFDWSVLTLRKVVEGTTASFVDGGCDYGNGLWMVGFGGNVAVSTDDCSTWVSYDTGMIGTYGSTVHIAGISYSSSLARWVIIHGNILDSGTGLGVILSSNDDGQTWDTRTSAHGTTSLISIEWYGTNFVVGGKNGTLQYSSDGETWVDSTPTDWSGTSYVHHIIIDGTNNKILAIGDTGSHSSVLAPRPFCYVSENDGVTWDFVDVGDNISITGGTVQSGIFMVSSSANTQYNTSDDLLQWHPSSASPVFFTRSMGSNSTTILVGGQGKNIKELTLSVDSTTDIKLPECKVITNEGVPLYAYLKVKSG